MRFFHVCCNDIRYQIKYGFYLIYTVITVIYIILLGFFDTAGISNVAASLILLSDPAVLGFFFIGGIWLLEKEEGLHHYLAITPQRSVEYVLAKAVSLGIISVFSAAAICLATVQNVRLPLLISAIFLSSIVFILIGLILATKARSVNAYMLYSVFPALILITPAILTMFGLSHPIFELIPGTISLHLIVIAVGETQESAFSYFAGLAFWLVFFLFIAVHFIRHEVHPKGGYSHAPNH